MNPENPSEPTPGPSIPDLRPGEEPLKIPEHSSPPSSPPPVQPESNGADDAFLNTVRARNQKKYVVEPEDSSSNEPSQPDVESTSDEDDASSSEADTSQAKSDSEDPIIDPLETQPKKKKTKADNMKNLRNSLKESRTTIDDLTTQLETATGKVKDIPDIETLQKTLEEKDTRIEELKKFEDLLGLYQTDGFKEKYYDGVDNQISAAVDIAKDYEVSEDIINQAVKITNRKELTAHLLNYFDQVSINDVRPLIIEAQKLLKERDEVELKPAQTKEELISLMRNKTETTKAQASETVKNSMSSAWQDITTLYSANESLKVLKKISGNEEHNKIRESLLTNSSEEFGKAMSALVDNGLKQIPSNLAKALAARFQLGEAAAHMAAENHSLLEELTQLKKELRTVNGYTRPLSNGNNVTSSGAPLTTEPPKGNSQIASTVMENAFSKLAAQEK